MKDLVYKEFKLTMHPTSIIFLGLSALMLIPNYPYYTTFFYTTLGLFFTCLSGRENNDIFYTMCLPIKKSDVVKARFTYTFIIEMLQMILAIPFAILRSKYTMPQNEVGIEANVAFFGLALIMLGIFNFVFYTKYYKNPDNVGKSFAVASTFVWLYIIIAEILVHAVPFMRDCIDTMDPEFMNYKLIFLAVGAVLYAALNIASYKKSVKSFEKIDL